MNFYVAFFWLILPVFSSRHVGPPGDDFVRLPKFRKISLNKNDYRTQWAKQRLEKMVVDIFDGKERSREDSKGNSLKKRLMQNDKQGTLIRCEQLYKGVNVFEADVIARRNNETKNIFVVDKASQYLRRNVELKPFQRFSGTFFESGEAPGRIPTANFNPDETLRRMKFRYQNSVRHDTVRFSLERANLVVYTDDSGNSNLAYSVSFLAERLRGYNISRPHYIIDAQTDRILAEWDGIRSQDLQAVMKIADGPGGNEKVGRYDYGKDRPRLEVNVSWSEAGRTCAFQTTKVVTMEHYWNYPHPYKFKFCKQEGDMVNGGYSPLNDAHFYATVTAEMFDQYYDPLKETLKPIFVIAHDWTLEGNAIWTGEQVRLGVGDEEYYPFSSSMDIVSHEIAHGVTEQLSRLKYEGQSGALDEAFSDMTAKAVQRYYKKDLSGVNWKFGSDVVRAVNGTLRCLDNPSCDGQSASSISNYQAWMKPHWGGGVFNKVFYELSQKARFDVWDAYDIFYVANREFWSQSSTFLEAAEGVLQAIEELKEGKHLKFHYTHLKSEDAIEAFKTVGINCYSSTGSSYTCNAV